MLKYLKFLPLLVLMNCQYLVPPEPPEDTDKVYSYERYCRNHEDDDGDGLVDCDDVEDCLERCADETDTNS
jgi:hypothetical protein